MKKWMIWSLMLALVISLLPFRLSAQAAAQEEPEAVQVVRGLGILRGDERGNLNLSQYVTRAEFVKMAISASKYKDSVGVGTGVSLYRDVKGSHWASRYIRLAVNEGWFTGYTDGTFRPEQNIKLEEGASVALRLLGYTSEDLQGSFPSAQLSKFSSLGLNADLSATPGSNLTRLDCAKIFSSLMLATTKSGEVYGSKLGYEIKNGSINYATLVNANTKGPFVVQESGFIPPFAGAVIWKNNAQSAIGAISPHDVYYYNVPMNTVWVYDNKVSGTLTEVGPNTAAPEKITVAGREYALGAPAAAFSVSSGGSFRKGDVVTLLLGKNGEAVQILSGGAASNQYYGVVISSEKDSTQIGTDTTVRYKVKIACTDGLERIFYAKSVYTEPGRAVLAKYEGGEARIENLPSERMGGLFTKDTFGTLRLSPQVQILDSDGLGGYRKLYPSRLMGSRLERKDVLYYSTNAAGEIEQLILQNASGDIAQYGIVTSARSKDALGELSGEYKWLINGEKGSLSLQNQVFSLQAGGAAFTYKNGEVSSIRNLRAVTLSSVTALSGKAADKTYAISEQVQVYVSTGNSYSLSSLDAVLHSDRYSFTGYVDDFGSSAGGLVRILVVHER